MKKNRLFREESLKRLSSPDDFGKYLKVINPSYWVVLLAVLIILVGVAVWSFVGNIENTLSVQAQVDGGVAHFTASKLERGMQITIGDTRSSVRDVGVNADGEYIGAAEVPAMADGTYSASIVISRANPISLLMGNQK
ncbi:MAG: hypothetical protein IJJ79_01155 [Lachnospiraceae bacterium]|nr:hypothetical protein [Lachnospiraceae bacterium]